MNPEGWLWLIAIVCNWVAIVLIAMITTPGYKSGDIFTKAFWRQELAFVRDIRWRR